MLSPALALALLNFAPVQEQSTAHRETSTADCQHLPAPPINRAESNDNRVGAGTLQDGVLTVRLVARTAAWRPDGPTGCALEVNTFAEEGGSPQIPGPLIRVRAGTTVQVHVRNALPTTLWLRGLQDRGPGTLDSVAIASGAIREFRFVATSPGAWYYWAGGIAARVPTSNADGQLVGALVVDPEDAAVPPREDRVLVLTRWTPTGTPDDRGFQVNAFNGRSWPDTERLRYTVGDSVRWHVINASDGTHEMHLHGFFFRLDAKGFAIDSTNGPSPVVGGIRPGIGPIMRVTAVLRPGEWLSMTWSPDRAGNWLYHCHLLSHMSAGQRLERMPGAAPPAHAQRLPGNHAHDDMGGLVLALDVRPPPTGNAGGAPDTLAPPRALDLFASARPGRFGERPGYGFVVQDGPNAPAADSIRIPGTPLVLTRDEPVRIAVHNRLPFAIAVHWHGIELESYYDGVGGFSGAAGQIAPMIQPNDSFVVRFSPPRAGTYMYHVHGERGEELSSGLYGPLLVLEPGVVFDPRTDLTFVAADGGPGDAAPVFVNGTATPDTLELVAGTTYRLRLLYIAANDVFMTTLRGPSGPEPARLIAFDGYGLPLGAVPSSAAVASRPLRTPTGPGHTLDFAFTPGQAGDYVLVFERLAKGAGSTVTVGQPTVVPIRVRVR